MKSAEEIKPCPFCGNQPSTNQDELGIMVFCENENCAIGDMSGCSVSKWNNQAIQSDATESTVRKCAEVASKVYEDSSWAAEYRHAGTRIEAEILSLIPQKEKKV